MESKVFVTKSVARYTSLLWSPNSPPQEVWLVTLDDLTKLSHGNSGGAIGYAGYAPAYLAKPAASSIYILYNIVYTLYL